MGVSSLAEFLQVLVVVLSFMALGVFLSLIVLIVKCMQGRHDHGFSVALAQRKTQASLKTEIKIVNESASPSPFPSPFPSPAPFRPIAIPSSPFPSMASTSKS